MPVQFRASSTANTGNAAATPIVVPIPSGSQVGDAAVLEVAAAGGTNASINTPTNWTFRGRADRTTQIAKATFTKILNAADIAAGSVSVSFDQGRSATAVMETWYGHDRINPFGGWSSTNGGAVNNIDHPAVVAAKNARVVHGAAARHDTSPAPSIATANNIERAEAANNNSGVRVGSQMSDYGPHTVPEGETSGPTISRNSTLGMTADGCVATTLIINEGATYRQPYPIGFNSAATPNAGATSLSVPLPSGWAAGQLAVIEFFGGGSDVLAPGNRISPALSGWTLYGGRDIGVYGRHEIWYRWLQAGDTAPNFTWTDTRHATAWITAIVDADPTNPFVSFAGATHSAVGGTALGAAVAFPGTNDATRPDLLQLSTAGTQFPHTGSIGYQQTTVVTTNTNWGYRQYVSARYFDTTPGLIGQANVGFLWDSYPANYDTESLTVLIRGATQVARPDGIPSAEAFGQAQITQWFAGYRAFSTSSDTAGQFSVFYFGSNQVGECSFAFAYIPGGSNVTVTAHPAGWEFVRRIDAGTSYCILIYRKYLDQVYALNASTIGTVTGHSGGGFTVSHQYTNVDPINPISFHDALVNTGAGTSIPAPGGTANLMTDRRMLIFGGTTPDANSYWTQRPDATRYNGRSVSSRSNGIERVYSRIVDGLFGAGAFSSPAAPVTTSDVDLTPQNMSNRIGVTMLIKAAPLNLTGPGIASAEAFGQATVQILDNPSDPVRFGLGEGSSEIVTERTLRSKKFLTEFGTVAAVMGQQLHYQEGVSYLDLDLDNDVVDATTWRMNKHAFQVEIKTGSNRGVYITERSTGKGIRIHLPSDPTSVSRRSVQFSWKGTTWTYHNRKRGIKLSATYATRQGPQAYTFNYTRLGGASHPSVNAAGDLVGDAYTIKRMFAEGADGEVYDAGAWAVDTATGTIQTLFDDTALPDAAFPYVLDPTTDLPRVSEPKNDAATFRTNSTAWPPDTSSQIAPADSTELVVEATRYLNASGNNRYRRSIGLLRFNTAVIPPTAFLQRAWLRVYVLRRTSAAGDAFGLTGELYDWSDPPVTGDYRNSPLGAAVLSTDLSNTPALSSVDIPVDITAINVAGETEVRLHPTVGRNPTGLNELAIATAEHPSAPEPQLVVEYSQGVAPRAFAGGSTGSGGTFVDATIPADVQVGDQAFVMIMGGAHSSASTRIAITGPTGWSLVPNCSTNYSTFARAELWTKRITQADKTAGFARWSFNGTRVVSWTFAAYQGTPSNAIENSMMRLDAASAKRIDSPDMPVAGQSERVVMWFASRVNTNLAPLSGSGLTERVEAKSGTSQFYPQGVYDYAQPEPGNTGVRSVDMAGTDASADRLSFAVALRPPLYVYPQGIPSAEAFGQATIRPGVRTVQPTGIPSAEAFGPAKVQLVLKVTEGIPSAEAFGPSKISAGITALTGIPSAEAFGQATIVPGPRYLQVSSIPSAEAFGQSKIVLFIKSTGGIPSGESFGSAGVVVETPPAEVLLSEEKRQSLMFSGIRGERKFEPRLFLSNIYGDELRELPGNYTGSIDLSNYRDNTWELSLTCEATDAFDPYTDYVLAAVDVMSDLDPWERHYRGLYRFEFPDGSDEPIGSQWNLTGKSLEMMMFRKAAVNGYRVGKNASIFASIRDIIQRCGIPPSKLTIPPDLHDKRLKQGARFDPVKDQDNAMFIRIANQILQMGGFGAIQTTENGQLFFNEIVPLDEKHPSVFYGPRERGGDDMIVYVGIPYEADYERFANEVYVYNANATTALTADTTNKNDRPTRPIKAVARNTNPDSKVSIDRLGYTVTKTISLQDVADQDAANRIARAELAKSSGYHLERKIQTLYDPRRGPDEAYLAEAYNAYGLRVLADKWQQVNVQFPMSKVPSEMVTNHTISRTEVF